MSKNRVLFIVGPTASGKSDIALELAQKINAEIISCDSMQVYKKIDILTQKPSQNELNRITHHLIGIIEPWEEFNAAQFSNISKNIIEKIFQKGKVPLVVGGTGLYMKALLDGIFQFPDGADKNLRLQLQKEANEKGSEYLYQKLKVVDSQAAEKIHPNDLRRMIRALEVYTVTGRPISLLQKETSGIAKDYETVIFGILRDRQDLYERIDRRVDIMFSEGAIEEVKKLSSVKISLTAQSAMGIREIKEFLAGKVSVQQAKHLLKINTRRFAKRQMTWFRKDKRIVWVEVGPFDSSVEIAGKILGKI